MRKGQSAGVKFALTCVIKNAILHITKNEIIKMEHAMKKLVVQDTEISMKKIENKDYISLTDMIKAKDGDFFISDWLRNRNTLEFLGIWERIYNPAFNYGEFAIIKSRIINSFPNTQKLQCISITKPIRNKKVSIFCFYHICQRYIIFVFNFFH